MIDDNLNENLEELEMQGEEFDANMEPILDEISGFLDKQKNKRNIMLNPRGVARLNAVYMALRDIMKKIDPDCIIKMVEDSIIKGTIHIELYCDEFIINNDNRQVMSLILQQCPTIDIYYTTHKGGKTVLVFEIPKVYVTF